MAGFSVGNANPSYAVAIHINKSVQEKKTPYPNIP